MLAGLIRYASTDGIHHKDTKDTKLGETKIRFLSSCPSCLCGEIRLVFVDSRNQRASNSTSVAIQRSVVCALIERDIFHGSF
jgi:hypothetical protein